MFFWDSVNWGEWALAYGKMAAVREGAADRIRREATIAMLIDPKTDGGGPQRVLGRLHDQTPHVPFLTGWASSREAVRFLKESYKIDPTNKITRVFLADAMVSNDSSSGPEAIRILREVISSPNDPNYEVENARAQEDAKALLREWGRELRSRGAFSASWSPATYSQPRGLESAAPESPRRTASHHSRRRRWRRRRTYRRSS